MEAIRSPVFPVGGGAFYFQGDGMTQKRWILTLVLVLFFLLCSCGRNIDKAANDWLKSQAGPALVDVSGEWNAGYAMGGGWGGGEFYQYGNDITGTLGFYTVRGVVSGTTLYLNLISGDSVYYTAKLEKKGEDVYRGKAVEGAVIGTIEAETATAYPIFLERME